MFEIDLQHLFEQEAVMLLNLSVPLLLHAKALGFTDGVLGDFGRFVVDAGFDRAKFGMVVLVLDFSEELRVLS